MRKREMDILYGGKSLAKMHILCCPAKFVDYYMDSKKIYQEHQFYLLIIILAAKNLTLLTN